MPSRTFCSDIMLRKSSANPGWFKETADQQIRMLILEYRIILASNAVILHSNSFGGCIEEWCNVCKNIKISYLYAKNLTGRSNIIAEAATKALVSSVIFTMYLS